jgi:uncharacterized protein (TIGR02270 family)
MAVSPRAFLIELYGEYLEEASFLYGQRRALLHDPGIPWKRIGEFEERLEAHLDGLVVGGGLALEVCARHAAEGDSGELFAAVCVFCRQDRREMALAALDRLDPGDPEKAGAAADALKYEIPATWVRDMLTLLENGDAKLVPILARAFGYRRVECGPQLLAAAKRCASAALPEVVWALGRLAFQPAAGLLLDYLRSEDEPVRAAAALALTRLGDSSAVAYCLEEARAKSWPILPAALGAGRGSLALFGELAGKSPESMAALGILGDMAGVPLLISKLADPRVAGTAADALEWLTGAGLHETVFVPDEPEEDRGDGRPFGSKMTRTSRDAGRWDEWWRANAHRFTPGVRYRAGAPLSPARLVEVLACENSPHDLRRYSAEEMATRYGRDSGFEVDTPVARQAAVLSDCSLWSASCRDRFREGEWYYGGYRRD